MSTLRDMMEADLKGVFLNIDEYGDLRTVVYDGTTYENIPVVLSGAKERDRSAASSDHAQGLYLVQSVMHCAKSDLGVQPEKGTRIRISDDDGFLREYYVAQSDCELGMLRIQLEDIEE